MRQAIMTSPGVIELNEVPAPAPGPGQVLLRIQRIGVCGSDIHVNHGLHPFTPYPVVQGHEYSAIVEGVGEGVEGIAIGAKVTATPQEVCGDCLPCRRGNYHICDSLKVRGFQAPGVAQDLYVTEADKIVALPDNFTHEQGAIVEPVAVACHSTNRAGNMQGKNVVVLGAGPIGNLIAQVAKCRGANVMVTDVSDFRLDKAKECGIENVSGARTEALKDAVQRVFGDDGFDIAIECAGIQVTISDAIECINKGGTIMIVGVFGEKPQIDMSVVGDRELSLVGSLMYQTCDYEEAVKLIASGEVKTEPFDSKHFPLEEYMAAYKFIDEQGEKIMKVFIDL